MEPTCIRNLNDVTMCGEDSEWLIACTGDGVLHSVTMSSGNHEVEHRFKKPKTDFVNPSIFGSHLGSTVLIEGVGENAPFDTMLHIWNQSNQTLRTVNKVPRTGWRKYWGPLAYNMTNSYATVWDMDKSQEIELPWRDEPIAEIECSADQSILFLQRKNGAIDVAKIDDGDAIPILRLAAGFAMSSRRSLTVCDDGRHLISLATVRDENRDDLPATTKTMASIYDMSDLN